MTDGLDEQHVPQLALALDERVHQRSRLAMLSLLAQVGEMDFARLGSVLGLSDGNLGRHVRTLAEAGMIALKKDRRTGRPRTWITITSTGRQALAHELSVLQQLAALTGLQDPSGTEQVQPEVS